MLRPPTPLALAALLAVCSAGCGQADEDSRMGAGAVALEQDLNAHSHTVCKGSNTLEGVDVSHYDGTVDWSKVAASGRRFAFAKATEGLTYVDTAFASNWAGMKQAGLVRGAYHFYRRNDDGAAQAAWFLSHVNLEPGDLPPVLDWEWETTAAVPVATDVQRAQQFVDEIRRRTGLTTILYSSANFLATVGSPTQFSGLPLWDAHYTSGCPAIPDAWATWTFWQYSGSGTVPGVGTPASPVSVDLNLFNGTQAQLLALTVSVDAGIDAGADAGIDAGPDAGIDAGPDAGIDAGPDAGIDAGPDAGIDAGPDAGSDAGHDAGTDAGTHDGGFADGGLAIVAPSGGCGGAGGASPASLVLLFLAGSLRSRRRTKQEGER